VLAWIATLRRERLNSQSNGNYIVLSSLSDGDLFGRILSSGRDSGGHQETSMASHSEHWVWHGIEFTTKRLDKLSSRAKIPPISGKPHFSLARPTVIARVYDFNPAVATPREEKHHE
jgi:hypothetical protein